MRCVACLIFIFLFFGLSAPVSAQSLSVTGPTGTLYCGFRYSISWTSTALASSTPLTIELWNESIGPDTLILTITTNAPNNGSYAWSIPTNNNNVLGTNEMYFYIYVTGGSTDAQGVSNTITRTSINSVQGPSGGAAIIGSLENLGFTYTAPASATVTVTLARNTSPITTIGSLLGPGSPIPFNTFTWTPSAQLAISNDYYLIVSIDQDPANARASSSVFTLFGATLSTSSVTTAVTTTTGGGVTPIGGSTTSTTGNSGVQVQWGGRYSVQAGCNTVACCCLTGDVIITQSGLNVAFSGGLTGNCAGATTLTASVDLPSLTSSTTSFTFFGQMFNAVRSGSQIIVTNINDPQCSGSAVCVSGACGGAGNTNTASSTSSDAPRSAIGFMFVVVVMIVTTILM